MRKFPFWMGIHCGENKGISMRSHVVFVNFNHPTLNIGKIVYFQLKPFQWKYHPSFMNGQIFKCYNL